MTPRFKKTSKHAANDEAELRRAHAIHGPEVFGLAYRALGDRHVAEEVAQETFMRAWRFRGRYDHSRASRKTWLLKIARNLVVDHLRAKAARPSRSPENFPESSVGEEDLTESTLISIELRKALSRISHEHRRVIFEIHYKDRPYAEVARELGVPRGTLRSRMYYALKSLRLALEERGYEYKSKNA